eukprot:365508-Chlamydomonas_euryale.AAC.10
MWLCPASPTRSARTLKQLIDDALGDGREVDVGNVDRLKPVACFHVAAQHTADGAGGRVCIAAAHPMHAHELLLELRCMRACTMCMHVHSRSL